MEPNAPNSLDKCKDGKKGDFLKDESIQSITVSAIGGKDRLEMGGKVEIEATVFAYADDEGTEDTADFYWAKNAKKPSWKYIDSVKPEEGGIQKLTVQHRIPDGEDFQAVRVNYRYKGSRSECSGGKYDDVDDLGFAVAEEETSAVIA